ncbi:Membrane protein involved in the export of O-antigen and teichoic acid [Modestobacter sp. DSM 44400]|uniref:oligosaccharide flippase family protein n=1 Tax=Modestobacter sp. DSM 44400 TaxID=1550230 RepID=UPI00089ADA5B|nr:oligosaccharide flippase family protein [Modestobacter sp. DSM 44400]SDX86497.1 Membrane protein involved in the export of O-antigen and teichoic acid [Modestobacter sp. DSM 44400]
MTPQLAAAEPGQARARSLARGGAGNLAGAVVAAAANVLLIVAVTRSSTPAAAGTFFTATSVFLIAAMLAKLGTSTGLVYFLSRSRALGQQHQAGAVLRVALTPVVVVSVLGAVALALSAPALASVAVSSHQDEFTSMLRWLAPFLPFAALTDSWLAATRGFGAMGPTVRIEKVARSGLQLVLVALAAAWASGPALSVAWAAPYVVAFSLAALAVRRASASARRRSDAGTPAPPAAAVAGPFWSFTWPRTISSVAQFALQRLDVIMVAALRGPAEAAVYTAATRFLVVGQLGAQAISSAAQPQLGEALARDDRAAANQVYRTATAWLVLITWPLYLMAAFFASSLLRVFGDGYSTGAEVVVVLALAMVVATGCGMVDMLLTMGGRTSWNLGNTLLALTVNIGLNLWLIPQLGILGAALAWAAAILVNNLVPLAQVGLVLGLHPFSAATARAALVTVTCFGAVPAGVLMLGLTSWAALAVSVAAGTALYAGALWWSRDVLQLGLLSAVRRPRPVQEES